MIKEWLDFLKRIGSTKCGKEISTENAVYFNYSSGVVYVYKVSIFVQNPLWAFPIYDHYSTKKMER